MKLTRASNYALVALAHLAMEDTGQPIASHLAARAQGIPERFLLKVLKPLVSARILRSVKGPNGGYRLLKPAKEVTLLEVVEAVDGPIRGQSPGLESGSDNKDNARLDKRLQAICDESANLVRERLQKVTLQDLVGKGKGK